MKKIQHWVRYSLLIGLLFSETALGNPTGPVSTMGIGSIQGLGTSLVTIQQTAPKGIINWQTFNIGAGEITQFIQPSAQSIVLNRINDANPSQILGSLLANGSVILLNPNGVIFGKGAQVNVNGLVASSLNLTDANFLNGNYLFEGNALNGLVSNAGTIQTGPGGYVYLFAPNVENSGVITTPEGHIVLAAGTSAYLSDRPDGLGFLVQVTAPAGEAANLGDLISDGGRINIYGQVINQSGLIQANSVRDVNGQIELYASQAVNLNSGSQILAKGDQSGVSSGGTVSVISDKSSNGVTTFEQGALIDVSGGPQGGNGGSVEISGAQLSLGGKVLGTAVAGYTGGSLLIDPYDLNLTGTDFNIFSSGGLDSVTFQADNNISVTNAQVDLTAWASGSSSIPTLGFQAGHDINFNNVWLSDSLDGTTPAKWNFSATAGHDLVFTQTQIVPGNGGGINVTAGNNIQLESGAGSFTYLWTSGGDIHLTAGGDLIAPIVWDDSYLHTAPQYSGIRLDPGPNGGQANLFVTLGGNFLGGTVDGVLLPPGFTLANGTAAIDLSHGGSFGSATGYGLITFGKGAIDITTQNDIYLGNIQDLGLVEQDIATVDPANQVRLTSLGGNIHLKPNSDNPTNNGSTGEVVEIYPASFSADAPQGNILIEGADGLKFWPSAQGAIDFHAWGNIEGPATTTLTGVSVVYADPSMIAGRGAGIITQHLTLDPTATALPNVIFDQKNIPAPIVFQTDTGDIANLNFHFLNPYYRRDVTISSGRDLVNFIAEIGIPDSDSKALVSAGRDVIFANIFSAGVFSGLSFVGLGEGDVRAGRNLDLATSNGIEDHLTNNIYTGFDTASGLLDISVGGALLMTKSKIWTYNGASIDIHGLNGNSSPTGFITRKKTDANGNLILDSSGNPVTEEVSLDVGSNSANAGGNDLGIVTLRGGDIHILASQDVNVDISKVATIAGGNINIVSNSGSINAGYGSPNDQVDFLFPAKVIVTTCCGGITLINTVDDTVKVPGSGIFTFDKDDPNPLPPYPPLQLTPSLEAERDTIIKESFLGLDVSAIKTAFYQEAGAVYASQKADFRAGWKLGNINLTAGQNVVVPPAGVRGKVVTIEAANLVLNGGQISGDLNLNVGSIQGNATGITGPLSGNVGNSSVSASASSGSSGLGGLSGTTGSVSTMTASSANVAPSAVQKSVAEDTESDRERDREDARNGAAQSGEGLKKKKHGGTSLQIKHGVVIEVETSEESGQGQ